MNPRRAALTASIVLGVAVATWLGVPIARDYLGYADVHEQLMQLQAAQDWDAQLALAEDALGRLEHLTDRQRSALLQMAIGSAVRVASQTDAAHLQPRVFEWVGQGRALAVAEDRAVFSTALGAFYRLTGRPGAAIAHLERAQQELGDDDAFQRMALYQNLADVYRSSGRFELRDAALQRALEIARRFVDGSVPIGRNFAFEAVAQVALARVDDMATAKSCDLDGVRTALELLFAAAARHPPLYVDSRVIAAEFLARCGATGEALEIVDVIKRIPAAAGPASMYGQVAAYDVRCTEALVLFYAERMAESVALIEQCLQARADDPHLPLHLAGRILEAGGNHERALELYRRSIERAERTRASFEVAARASFFRSELRNSYWGTLRLRSRTAAQTGGRDDFLRAWQAAELIRGRQLGDLISPREDAWLALEALAEAQRGAPAGEAVLMYTLTDTDIVLLAFDRHAWHTHLIQYDAASFDRLARNVAASLDDPDADAAPLAEGLAEMSALLLAPVAGLIDDAESLAVLSDGALNLVPFDLLSVRGKPLIDTKRVHLKASLRFRAQPRDAPRSAPSRALFAVADPTFAATGDANRREQPAASEMPGSALQLSDYLGSHAPLPDTRTEVESISALIAADGAQVLLGAEARESAIKSAPLADFRFVHLATHGVLGNNVAGLAEPALVFSPEPGEDGFLTASEAAALSLSAELTVLSACNTGSGRYLTGEGVLGMGRAFLIAGSQSVVMSLWSVPSRETEQLMVRFYTRLAAGESTAAALAGAKSDVRAAARAQQDDYWSHPFFWGAFVLFER